MSEKTDLENAAYLWREGLNTQQIANALRSEHQTIRENWVYNRLNLIKRLAPPAETAHPLSLLGEGSRD